MARTPANVSEDRRKGYAPLRKPRGDPQHSENEKGQFADSIYRFLSADLQHRPATILLLQNPVWDELLPHLAYLGYLFPGTRWQ